MLSLQRRGLALILVAGVLGVLAVLATAFVTMAQLERRAAAQRLHATRAVLLARSGIEDALARIAAGQDPDAAGVRYGGEDFDDDGSLSPGWEMDAEVFRKGKLNRGDCPAEHALRPSFFMRTPSGDPALRPVEGRLRGYSGTLGGDGIPEGNPYALKVIPQAGIHVNGGDPVAPPTEGYNAVLRRILGTLAAAVDREDGTSGDGPVSQADGYALIDSRPEAGWTSWDEVRDTAFSGSQGKLDALREYLALHAWVDRKVIRPNVTAAPGTQFTTWMEVRLAHDAWPSAAPGTQRAPDFERIPVAPTGAVVGRAPVNLAWARSRRPVLIALVDGLAGLYVNFSDDRGGMMQTIPFLKYRQVALSNTWTAGGDCFRVVNHLLASTADLSTWEAWDAFCDTVPVSGDVEDVRAKRDLLKAQFNPNSDLNKSNPGATMWNRVDKQDLTAYSTEFCLEPLHGYEVESQGRVLDARRRLLASRTVRASLAAPRALRLTTQREFVCEDLGLPEVAGDEAGVRLPGWTRTGEPGFITQSRGTGRTWGHRIDMRTPYPGTWLDGGVDARGISLQTYPEPCFDAGAGLSMTPADYDGNIQLATVETIRDAVYGVIAATTDMRMLGRFDSSLDLDLADAGGLCSPDQRQVRTSELRNGLLHAAKPSGLHPDGVYSEYRNAPAYPSLGNMDGTHALVSLWSKANYERTLTRKLYGVYRFCFQATNVSSSASWLENQFLGMCQSDADSGYAHAGYTWGFMYESGHHPDDREQEHEFRTQALPERPHRWTLSTFQWDLQVPTLHLGGEFVLDGGGGAGETGSYDLYHYPNSWNDQANVADLTLPDAYGAHRVVLGSREVHNVGLYKYGADATLDEFVLYDFGPSADKLCTQQVADGRFKEGRYYKGAEYVDLPASMTNPPGDQAGIYVSPAVALPPGSRLRGVSWTFQRPPELPGDYAEVELTDAAGADYLWGEDASRSTRGPGWRKELQRWALSGTAPDRFRFRVVFRRDPDFLPGDDPVLESPAFDDLTFRYEPPGGSRVLQWGQE